MVGDLTDDWFLLVGDSDRHLHILDDGAHGGIGMCLHRAVSEIASEPLGLDNSAVELRGSHELGGRPDDCSMCVSHQSTEHCNEHLHFD